MKMMPCALSDWSRGGAGTLWSGRGIGRDAPCWVGVALQTVALFIFLYELVTYSSI